MGCCVGGWVEGENVRAEGQGGRYYSGGEETGLRSNVRRRVGRGEIGKIKIDIYIAKAKSPISLVPGLVPLEVIRLIVRRREQGKPQYESAKTTVTFLPSFLPSLPPFIPSLSTSPPSSVRKDRLRHEMKPRYDAVKMTGPFPPLSFSGVYRRSVSRRKE